MPNLSKYQLLDKTLPAILMVGLVVVAFVLVLLVTIAKCVRSKDDKGKKPPRVFIEIVKLYFPDITVHGKKIHPCCFGAMSILLIPIIVGTMFITFWNVYLVDEAVRGNCEANFDCFPKVGDDFLQQEPVNNCSVFELDGDVTYECYRLVFRYAEGLGAAGGLLVFTAAFSKLYFSLLVTIYNEGKKRYCKCIFYFMTCSGAAITFILFIALSVGLQEMQEAIFQTVTYQIQFAMYALSLLVILVSGVVVAFGIEFGEKEIPKEQGENVVDDELEAKPSSAYSMMNSNTNIFLTDINQ